jgi:hypothetical protein
MEGDNKSPYVGLRTPKDFLVALVCIYGDAIILNRNNTYNLSPEQLQIERDKLIQRAEILMTQEQGYSGGD